MYRLTLIAFLILFLYLFLGGPYGLIKIISLYSKIKKIESKTDRFMAEKVILTKKCESLKTDLFIIEKIARQKLGMIKNGEIVYRIIKKK